MTDKVSSYRRILKTSSITGGSSVINILISVLRTKVLAILLGPSGIGLVGLYTGLMSTATTIASLGIGTIGTRQIAEAIGKQDDNALAIVRRAMFWGMLMLATTGALVVWSLREILAVRVLGGVEHTQMVGWLALGVAFSVASASQGALIQGMRRIGDMAKLSVYGAILNTVLGIGLLWQWGGVALWAFILIGPLFNFLLGHLYVSKLPKTKAVDISLQDLLAQWKIFLQLGLPFMAAGLMQTVVQLWIRVSVSNQLGLEAVGHFQAAWAISMQYIGFVLGAMGADYYPRLTGIIHDKVAASRLVNEQTEIALLLSAPIFIAMIGLAPWIVNLLYSSAFSPAIDVLRWQILGDLLKVVSWPMGFVILAAGAGKTFFWTDTMGFLLMGCLVAVLLPSMGLQITGIAFLACYVYYLPLVYFLAWRRIQFMWTSAVFWLLVVTLTLCVAVLLLSTNTEWGIPAAIGLSVGFGCFAVARLIKMVNLGRRLRLGN
ncbi:MAG: O-antigen translocase [Methylococcaceae bacterium]|nr:O-antigen translocase [Methylococcaceae bacterium]